MARAADRVAAVDHVIRTAERQCGLSRDELRLGGPTVDAATIDVESERLLLELSGLSAVIAFLVAWQRLRQLRVRPDQKPVVRFETEPGRQAQMDWAVSWLARASSASSSRKVRLSQSEPP